LEIDNKLVENSIRPTSVCKKSWLFFGEAEAGERSAIIYTVIESCRRRGIDPFVYLHDAFTRSPSITNWQIKTSRRKFGRRFARLTPIYVPRHRCHRPYGYDIYDLQGESTTPLSIGARPDA
jgi:hypothetical protein